MRTDLKIDIGGEGNTVEIDVKITGCECRSDDFLMALIRFSNEWKNEADGRHQTNLKIKDPCQNCGQNA